MEARLTAVVSTKGAVKANKELNSLAKNSKKVETNVIRAEKRFKSFGKNAAASIALIDGPLGGISSRVSSMLTIFTSGTAIVTGFAAAFVGLGFVLVKGISNLDEFEVNLKRVNATIKATGAGVGFTGEALRDEAESIALATLTSVEAVQKAQAKLLTFNRVLGDEFSRSIKLSQDLAEAGFGSIESNAILLGKALQDPIKGMASLSRVGVTLSETQKQLARDAVNTGDVFAAQGIILDAIAGQVDGVAEAVASGTLSGAVDTLGQNWDELTRKVAENSGALSVWIKIVNGAAIRAKEITDALTDDSTEKVFQDRFEATLRLNAALEKQEGISKGNSNAYNRQASIVSKLRAEVISYDKALKATIKSDTDRVNAAAKASEREIEARKKITAEVKAEADAKTAKEKEKETAKFDRKKAAAQRELETILNLNNSELEAIQTLEDKRITIAASSYAQQLISFQDFQAAKTEIELSADKSRQAIADKEIAAAKSAAKSRLDIEEITKRGRLQVLDSTQADLKTILGEENKLFKAAAITNTTIKTYESATSAYSAMAGIPVVGPALGIAAAGIAVTAGLANVGKIVSAREQGGTLSAGQASTVAERGQLEILTPTSSSRIRTKQQMQQLMGNDGNSSPVINVVNINQSNGPLDIQTTTDDDGRIINLIRSTVSLDAQNGNSEIRKSFGASTNLEARF